MLAGIGALFTGSLADRYGRRKILLVNSLICIIGSVVTAFSYYYAQLLVGRFIIGITSGVATGVSSVYLNEISPIHLRGTIGTTIQLVITIAIFFSEVLGKLWQINNWFWRVGCIIPAILSLVQFIVGYFALPSSPQWLAETGDLEEAKRTLFKLRGNYQTLEIELQEYLHAPTEQVSSNLDTHGATLLGNDEFNNMSGGGGGGRARGKTFEFDASLNIFSAASKYPVIAKVFGISVFIHALQQFSGINVVFYYSSYLLETAGVSSVYLGSLAIAFANFLSVFLATWLIERRGRRSLFLISSAGMVLSSVLLTVMFVGLRSTSDGSSAQDTFSVGAIICLVLYVVTFELGLGPIPWLFVAEISPIEYRGKITSMAQMVNYSCNTIIALTSTSLLDALGKYGFVPFGVICAIGTIVNYKVLPETKQKTVEQVLYELKR